MNLTFDPAAADVYRSPSQRIRVLTERWASENLYCPGCGAERLRKRENNSPVRDFVCEACKEEFELKSQKKPFGKAVADGAYSTMIERLGSRENPNLMLLHYDAIRLSVVSLTVVPKQFFIPDIVKVRSPLSARARRAGWIGCNILLELVPSAGRIFLIRDRVPEARPSVLHNWKQTLFLRKNHEIDRRRWLLDVMSIVDRMGRREFTLSEVYGFEQWIGERHPGNRHVRAKIRQQLQVLRGNGYIEFIGGGRYRRL